MSSIFMLEKNHRKNDKLRNSFIGIQLKCKGDRKIQGENKTEGKGYGSKCYKHEQNVPNSPFFSL